MTTGHVYIAQSLDGYIARPNNEMDWLLRYNKEGEDHGFDDFIKRMDGLIMGSNTFKTVLSFEGEWPYYMPVFVMSKSLTDADVPEHLRDRVWITDKEPADLMDYLARADWLTAYIDGGAVIESFMRAGLVEDIRLFTVPVLIGEGRKLFGNIGRDVSLELLSTEDYASGIVKSHYRIKKDAK
ncbi:dihydrofolate reductase family protein [Pseudovibrio sp. SPO723]|uniref:dihydrofolate reductase family protein n=1 Tax=Nesiotobacter zosterae TaxID=392721 RepID=UPI0029C4A153|nr:dihydrofolate reductase family protein [Pseudovibrio sp. SPO723]MDX5594688.1 dihydrofolate reductase family protein [Pseudovibrio sp. SPO723]